MSMINISDELNRKEREFHGKPDIFGMTLLTNPGYISANRSVMLTSHLKQFVVLQEPEFPILFTHYENIVGKHSSGYKKAKSRLQVIKKIPRFEGDKANHIYAMFFYDEENDYYSMILKKNVENLTEGFGFEYKYDVLDKKKEDDYVEEGEVLYKTTSYDEDMNYGYGRNVLFMYSLHPDTIEDAIICSKSFAKSMNDTGVETVKVSINDNDVLLNLYGEDNRYQPFPEIGQKVKNKLLCATRRLNNSQLLFDLKDTNLNNFNYTSGDTVYIVDGVVEDIIIYANKPLEDIKGGIFYQQIRDHLRMQNRFYQEIYDICDKIIKSGSKYSGDIGFYYKKASDILHPETKWKEENNSVFSNIVLKFVVKRNKPSAVGQKITGRYGNKGVISKIWDDERMPVLDDGRRVDLIFNSLGVINRLNSYQLFESSITFICGRVIERLRQLKELEEREELLFDIIGRFNKSEADKLRGYYDTLTELQKEEFFGDIYKTGIFIHIPPMWADKALFDVINDIYKDYDFIKPYKVSFYNPKFKRTVPVMKDLYVGSMYIIKLKQSSQKGFSARSTGALNRKGVPEKSTKAKNNMDLHSKKPLRIGEQENTNALIGVTSEDIAILHKFYRSSPKGRRWLGKKLLTELDVLEDFIEDASYKNRNLEILQAYLKTLGLKLEFLDDRYRIHIQTGAMRSYDRPGGGIVISTSSSFHVVELREAIRKEFLTGERFYIGTDEGFEKMIKRETQRRLNKG